VSGRTMNFTPFFAVSRTRPVNLLGSPAQHLDPTSTARARLAFLWPTWLSAGGRNRGAQQDHCRCHGKHAAQHATHCPPHRSTFIEALSTRSFRIAPAFARG